MRTNVKKMILTIMLIVDIVMLAYANTDVSKLYINSKNKTMVLLFGSKNIEHKDEFPKNRNIENSPSKQQPISNKNTKQLKQPCTTNKTIQEDKVPANSNKNQDSNQLSRGSNLGYEIDIVLTFYTSLAEENGGYRGINCLGQKLTPGMVANNVLPLGTEIHTSEFGTLTVSDRGGNNFNTIHRLDVYIPRNNGESDSDYLKRVNDMGKVKVNGYIIKQ
ncbi:hypothetical protein JMF89_11595 [Clostridiaceae bacterium UIB06]|uniref:3D domain-containing protein n=1 Tax=Clostridium thailandense TaxID=2794346 RepID=A0A949U2J5_9CLOT|nr:hypothetical protein [Clostridium thailandense]MBV7275174.1 hypothetical protein [Clostridium thailandense]MCH5137842.1 hypothetical protein [Clostridiaceae bacterium UIB06]